jgi:CRISPR-associated exonuclease Cas4
MLSNIQHFSFCKRQWSFIVVENQWVDNKLTVEGTNIHKKADDETFIETRNDVITSRSIPVVSYELGLSGKCDVVEFHKDENGVNLPGKKGKYIPIPVEYKRGSKKADDIDIIQLCAQSLCLEEMLGVKIPIGYMFYHKTRRREEVLFTEALKDKVRSLSLEMHEAFRIGKTYPPEFKKGCNNCSFYDICLPDAISKRKSVQDYINENLNAINEIK